MTRITGTWASLHGQEFEVVGRIDLDTLTVIVEHSGARRVTKQVPLVEVSSVFRVRVSARWRDGEIVLGREVAPGVRIFDTADRELAQRESLSGDQYSGWGGQVAMKELQNIRETVKVLRKGGQP